MTDLTKPRRTTPPTLEEQTEAWQHIAKRDAKLLEALALSEAAARLRAAGWTVLPPSEAIPEPAVGQVWLAGKKHTHQRMVRVIDGQTVLYTSPSTEKWGAKSLSLKSWHAWARKSGARPEVPPLTDAQREAWLKQIRDLPEGQL